MDSPPPKTSFAQEFQKRYNQARQVSLQPDPPAYQGEALREYQKELHRKIQAQGADEILGSPLQRQIHDMNSAVLLLAAGYNRDTVVNALNDASPQAAHKTDYGQGIVKTVWEQPQVKQFIADRMIWKAQQGIPLEEKRLDRLHLATDVEHQPEPLKTIAIERD
jgi:hypothetical protein